MNTPQLKWLFGSVLCVVFFFVCVLPLLASPNNTIVVGSKNFLENRLLAEMFAQLIEVQTTLRVERRLGLAGTHVCFEALKTGGLICIPNTPEPGL